MARDPSPPKAVAAPLAGWPISSEPANVETPWRKVLKATVICLMHISVSSVMILFNRRLMMPERFPHSITLTTMHMCSAFVFANLLRLVRPDLLPSSDQLLGKTGVESYQDVLQRLWPFIPIGLVNGAAVLGSNGALLYASVPFLQMIKESMVLWTYLIAIACGMEAFRMRNIAVLCLVAVCAAIAIHGEIHFRWLGFWLQVFAAIGQSLSGVGMSRLMSGTAGSKVDPITLVMLTAPGCMAVLLPMNYFEGSAEVIAQFRLVWDQILLSCLIAFTLQVVNMITIKELSATGLALAAVLKDLMIVGSAVAILGESFTPIQTLGFSGSIFFISLYSVMKLFPTWFQ